MDNLYNNIRTNSQYKRICSKNFSCNNPCNNQRYICEYKARNSFNLKLDDGQIATQEIVLQRQEGAVIYGIVLFENGMPAQGATVVLSCMDEISGKAVPVSFMFTDENGLFIFGIYDTQCDYLINIVYN